LSTVTLELGWARVRKDRDDVAKDRRVAFAELMLRPIDEAGSLIVALVVVAMLQRGESRERRGERRDVVEDFKISDEESLLVCLLG